MLTRRSLGSVLVRLPDGPLHTLGGTACEVWDLLHGEPTAGEVADALATRYEVPVAGISPDIDALLTTLAAAGLVVTRTGGPAPPALA